MSLTKNTMITLSDEVVSGLKEYFEDTQNFETNLDTFYRQFSSARLAFCLDNLIEAEFDTKTPGDRGLGRVSNDPPRLGGHFRKRVSKLNQSEADSVKKSIRELMLKCYLFMISTMGLQVSHSTKNDALFNEWLPEVYMFNLYNLGERTVDVLFSLVQRDYEALKQSLKTLQAAPAIAGEDVINNIVSGYAAAGVVLALADQTLGESQ